MIIDHSNGWAETIAKAGDNYFKGQAQGAEMARMKEILTTAREARARRKIENERADAAYPQDRADELAARAINRRQGTASARFAEAQASGLEMAQSASASALDRYRYDLSQEAQHLADKYAGGKLPPEIKARLDERTAMLEHIQGATPAETEKARAFWAEDSKQALEKDFLPVRKGNVRSKLANMLGNPQYGEDPRASATLSSLEEQLSPVGGQEPEWNPDDVDQKLSTVMDLHAQRERFARDRMDFEQTATQARERLAQGGDIPPETKGAINQLIADVNASKYDGQFDKAHAELEKLMGQGRNSPEALEGRGRTMDQMPARVRASLRMQAREVYEPKLLKMVADGTIDRSEYKSILSDLIDEALPDLAEAAGWAKPQEAAAGAGAPAAGPAGGGVVLSARDSYLLQQAQAKGDNAAIDALYERTGVRSVGPDGSVSMKKLKLTPFDQNAMSQADQAEQNAAREKQKGTLKLGILPGDQAKAAAMEEPQPQKLAPFKIDAESAKGAQAALDAIGYKGNAIDKGPRSLQRALLFAGNELAQLNSELASEFGQADRAKEARRAKVKAAYDALRALSEKAGIPDGFRAGAAKEPVGGADKFRQEYGSEGGGG